MIWIRHILFKNYNAQAKSRKKLQFVKVTDSSRGFCEIFAKFLQNFYEIFTKFLRNFCEIFAKFLQIFCKIVANGIFTWFFTKFLQFATILQKNCKKFTKNSQKFCKNFVKNHVKSPQIVFHLWKNSLI